ncbi:MAG: MFS transporter, partial [Clostridia bacterium]|nr:MFS transporter [Clostridia bacterium]
IIIKLLNWRFVFALFGFAALCFSFVWITKTKKIMSEGGVQSITVELENVEFSDIPKENKAIQTKEEKKAYKKRLLALGFVPIFISTFIAGFIRDGISTWLPTYINEVYNLGSFSSILTGAVIPFCCALFLELLNVIGEKIGNEVKAASLFGGIATTACGAMFLLFSKIPALDVAFMALITICVHGVNLMLVCNLPKRFSKYGKSSTLSGILNSAVYAGAALSIYGTAFVSTEYGWKAVTLIWTCLISISFILCFSWKKRFIKNV